MFYATSIFAIVLCGDINYMFSLPLCRHPLLHLRSTTVCVLDAQYELDGVSGITYELNKTSFEEADPNFFQDVEYGSTTLTLSAASINRNNGRHGGGYISMQPGATANKEKRGNSGGGQGQGQGLRGGGQDSSLFDRRRLAQKTGNR